MRSATQSRRPSTSPPPPISIRGYDCPITFLDRLDARPLNSSTTERSTSTPTPAALASNLDTIDAQTADEFESTRTNTRDQARVLANATVYDAHSARRVCEIIRSHWGNDYSTKQTARGAPMGITDQHAININLADYMLGTFASGRAANPANIMIELMDDMVRNFLMVAVFTAADQARPQKITNNHKMRSSGGGECEEEAPGLTNSTLPEEPQDTHDPSPLSVAAAERIVNYINSEAGKIDRYLELPEEDQPLLDDVRGMIMNEIATWAGYDRCEDIPGYDDALTIHFLTDFLKTIATTELGKMASRQGNSKSTEEDFAIERYKNIGQSEVFKANSVRQVLAACTAEADQIISQLKSNYDDEPLAHVMAEERRRDTYTSGPLGYALNMGIGFAGFGQSLIQSYEGKITQLGITEELEKLSKMAMGRG